jgi:hypothetical protein
MVSAHFLVLCTVWVSWGRARACALCAVLFTQTEFRENGMGNWIWMGDARD